MKVRNRKREEGKKDSERAKGKARVVSFRRHKGIGVGW